MFNRSNPQKNSELLKPFVIRIHDGWLVGLNNTNGPCSDCIGLWLKDRNVFYEKASVSDLTKRRDILADLLTENDPSVLYEITKDKGITSRLDCFITTHPNCTHKHKISFIKPKRMGKDVNFAFTPVFQIKCIRYGTPNGNLWLTSATGNINGNPHTEYSVVDEREKSRFEAVQAWFDAAKMDCVIGKKSDHKLNKLSKKALDITLNKYRATNKHPMLIVGTNSWIRNRVPFFLLQNYDVHLVFYPNSSPTWVIGAMAVNRNRPDAQPIWVFGSGNNIEITLRKTLQKLLIKTRPTEKTEKQKNVDKLLNKRNRPTEKESRIGAKYAIWKLHWLYRCPKISLKDVLHLEAYPYSQQIFKEYFAEQSKQTQPEIPSNVYRICG